MVTYAFEIAFGLAGTIMMLFVMTFFMSAKTLVIYSVLPQIIVATIALVRSPDTVDINFLFKMLLFAAFGSVLGFYLFYSTSVEVFQYLLAGMITLSGAYMIFSKSRIKLTPVISRVLDTASGTSMAMFGISGPIAMTRLLATFDKKTVIRNYALAFFLSLNLIRTINYIINGDITHEIGNMMLYSAPFLVIALWFANNLHFKVNETMFRYVLAWVIFLGGVSLFFS